ncbi:hypothetical protein HMI54_000997 [Coelomomyces lativittatus]|nr:hypothetical protein HMI56_001661 [Coelomomyces lativittatus]KAJ1511158.1 hypothetical protein HMI54_000997 [Coelomomyces lativittatus]
MDEEIGLTNMNITPRRGGKGGKKGNEHLPNSWSRRSSSTPTSNFDKEHLSDTYSQLGDEEKDPGEWGYSSTLSTPTKV